MNDHPYTYDRWATPDDPEFAVVRVDDLRKMERASQGIWAIARIVGNGVNEPGATGSQPLHAWVMSNLMGGVESLCDHLAGLAHTAIDCAPLSLDPPTEPMTPID
ncbi:hypothetical protein J2732_001200 [Achromobacter deleyi]|uniref:hypothetical protein n=1 Tax=Achromobacter deleyi TaxID=1353891 RepID=UPI0028638CEC|nr:hypothetical protein [Achromobacter deleyi]MDR6600217.1 hypothetical protein [Achromobacter deleyi]